MKSNGSSSDFMKHVSAAMVVIRQQRQRASLERICRSLRLHQLLANVNEKEVETELEAAVQRRELYAVDKRGYRSYQVTVCFVTIFCTDVTIIEIEIEIVFLTEHRIESKSYFSCIPSNDLSIEALDRLLT